MIQKLLTKSVDAIIGNITSSIASLEKVAEVQKAEMDRQSDVIEKAEFKRAAAGVEADRAKRIAKKLNALVS